MGRRLVVFASGTIDTPVECRLPPRVGGWVVVGGVGFLDRAAGGGVVARVVAPGDGVAVEAGEHEEVVDHRDQPLAVARDAVPKLQSVRHLRFVLRGSDALRAHTEALAGLAPLP